jgi:bacteriocin biosynthesis cyclodehydratase domain-containing protein
MLIITAGNFGGDVARRIARRRAGVSICDVHAPAEETFGLVAGHEVVLLAVWRPYIEFARGLDEACHVHGRPWAAAEMSGTTLTCGPLFVPGSGKGCYDCLLARVDARARGGDRTRALRAAYAADPALGPTGHSGPMAAIAAAGLLEAAAGGANGRFRKVDVLTGSVLETELIPRHDCPRCRPAPEGYIPTSRFIDSMVPQLERILA